MKRSASPLMVGGFVVGALVLAIAAVMILWGGRLFTRSHRYVLYFNGDVNGLRTGAAVKFKGVQVGYVHRILLSLNPATDAQPPQLLIPVVVELESREITREASGSLDLNNPLVVQRLVQHGLRGQLATESLLTGILYVSLDMRPDTKMHLRAPPNSTYPEIPTLPTPIEQAQQLAVRALTRLGQIDLDAVAANINKTLDKTGELVASPQLRAAIESLPVTINKLGAASDSIKRLADNANRQVALTADSLRKTTASANLALNQTQETLKAVSATVGPESPLNYQLGQTLTELSEAARSIRDLAEYLDRNPNALLRGRSPEEKR